MAGSALPWHAGLLDFYPEILFIYKFQDDLNPPPWNYDYKNKDHYDMKPVETWKKYKVDNNTMTKKDTQFYVDLPGITEKCKLDRIR